MIKDVTENVKYIGADDPELELFESQYHLPEGMCYNSYVILDEKIAVLDTIDERKTDEWFDNLDKALGGRKPDYLVISHLEPDHAANIANAAAKYPEMKLVGNAKTFAMLPQFFDIDVENRKVVVKEKDSLDLGGHKLTFYTAPMVHWPEVMVCFEETEMILFSADAFGKFGVMDAEPDDWACEARRYYFNICGKYGAQVQGLLKKAAALDIKTICPLHGPILTENLSYYIGLYDTWSKYEAETDGIFIAYGSIHGGTKKAAEKLYEILSAKTDKKISISDLSRSDMHENIEDAFRYSKMVMLAPSYDGGLFPPAADFINLLKSKTYRSRKVALVENFSWAASAGRVMKEAFEGMKDVTLIGDTVSIKSTVKPADIERLEALADAVINA